MERDEPAFGGWVTTESEANISMFGRLGYDYVGIDTQHSAVSEAQAAVLVRRLVAAPFGVIVRVSKNDPALIGRLLDSGADGIIVPMVSTAEEAGRPSRPAGTRPTAYAASARSVATSGSTWPPSNSG